MATINNLYIDQGTTFSAIIQVFDSNGDPFNLSGYSIASQIRKNYSTSTIAATFTTDTVSAANGTLSLNLTASETGNLKYGRYLYDVEITGASQTLRAAEGIVVVYPQITK